MKTRIVALLLLCSLPAWPQSEPLGRLFFTPQQRAELDRQRQGLNANTNDSQKSSYTLNGEVHRSSGHNTRWVNGEAQSSHSPRREVVGDTYHPSSGERQSLLGSGRIVVQQPRP